MAVTMTRETLRRQVWSDKAFTEITQTNLLAQYQGTDTNAVVQVTDDLKNIKGDKATFNFVGRLRGDGVKGNEPLWGRGEALDERSLVLRLQNMRHSVEYTEWDDDRDVLDLMDQSQEALNSWAIEKTGKKYVESLSAVTMVDGEPVPYATATAAQRNAWSTNNADRIVVGNAFTNLVAGNMASSLLNVDDTNDLLSPTMLSNAKLQASLTLAADGGRRIRPTRVKNTAGRGVQNYYVCFAGTIPFRDLQQNAEIKDAMKMAMERGEGNPLFQPGDILWDNIVVRQMPELPNLIGVGAAGINVAPIYLCGAQALGWAWKQRPRPIFEGGDYGPAPDSKATEKFKIGIGIQFKAAFGKLMFGTGAEDNDNMVDAGIVTMFASARK